MYDRLAAALLGLSAGTGHMQKVMSMPASRPTMRSPKRKGVSDKIIAAYNDVGNSMLGKQPTFNPINVPPPSTPQDARVALATPQVWGRHLPKGIPSPDPSFQWDQDAPTAAFNMNADRVYLAKSLGGTLAGQTRIGNAVQQTRKRLSDVASNNPLLAKALLASSVVAPAGYSAAVAGDDDTDEALAIALAPAIPALVDETVATVNGQRILDKAGLRTSLGQRGKFAGNLLSYAAPAVIAGSLGNFAGNLLDQDQQTTSTLEP